MHCNKPHFSPLLRLLLCLPAVLWYGLIWYFSAQPAVISEEVSNDVLYPGFSLLSPIFAAADPFAQNSAAAILSFFERKAAHMFLYFVLALLLLMAFSYLKKRIPIAMGFCALLAALDEYHQTFVPGRSGQVQDVLIDSAGGAIALLLVLLALYPARQTKPLPCRIALLPAVCAAVLAAFVAAMPATGLLPVLPVAANQLIDGFLLLPETERTAMLYAAAPLLRDVLFLFLCGLSGACVQLFAALRHLGRYPSLLALALVAVLTGGMACLASLSLTAIPLSALGYLLTLPLRLPSLLHMKSRESTL